MTVKATDKYEYNPATHQKGSKKHVEEKDVYAAIKEYGEWTDAILLTSPHIDQSNDLQKALESWPSEKPIISASHDSHTCAQTHLNSKDTVEITQYTNNWAYNFPIFCSEGCNVQIFPIGFHLSYKEDRAAQ